LYLPFTVILLSPKMLKSKHYANYCSITWTPGRLIGLGIRVFRKSCNVKKL
jgi:hypothetical protein